MMKINQFDRTNLRVISAEIEAALKPVADKYGIQFKYGGARFSPETATFKVEGATIGTNGTANTKERQDFLDYAEALFGLKSDMIDGTVVYRGESYTITGLSTRKHKAPIHVTRNSDGKRYNMPAIMVLGGYRSKA